MADEGEVELESLSDESLVDTDRERLVSRRHPSIDIIRERLNEAGFEAGYSRVPKSQALRERMKAALPPEPVRSALVPPLTAREWLEFLLVHVPIIRWVWTYQTRFLVGDIIAGINVAIMHIPQGLAYALLAHLDPVYGLYTSFMPSIIYSFLGTSRHISVGTVAIIQLMIGNSIEKILASDPKFEPCLTTADGNQSSAGDEYGTVDGAVNGSDIDCSAEKVSIAVTIALVSGVIMLVMGIAQLGFITIFLSESLVSGYITAAACHVFTFQLTHILGIRNEVPPGVLRLPKTWIFMLSKLSQTNWATLIISVLAIAALILFRFANKYVQKLHVPLPYYSRGQRRWKKKRVKWSIPIPSQLIVVIVCALISYLADFEDRFSVIVVGHIPQGVPEFTNPLTGYVATVIIDSFIIAIVVYCISVSMAQVFARKYDYSIHSNQEFLAYGVVNIVSSFFGSFTASTGLSRGLVQANSGGKTQLVGFVSSGIILVVLLWLGALFSPLPRAVLASIVWVALYGMFTQIHDVWKYFKLSFSDMLIWLVVFFATVFLGVDLGLGVGVGFSLLIIIVRTVLPTSTVLGQAKNTELFRSTEVFQVETIPGVIIYRFMAPICFVNAAVFRKRLEMVSDLHKRPKPGGEEKGCLQKLLPSPETCLRKRGSRDRGEEEMNGILQDTRASGSVSFQRAKKYNIISDRDLRVTPRPKPPQLVHTVIIDCAPVGFLDAVGVKALKQIVLDFDKCDVQVLFAAMTQENRDMLDRAKFYEVCGKEWLFPSIQDAVHHAQFGDKLHPAGRDEESLATALGSVPTEDGESQSQEEEGGGGEGEGGGREGGLEVHETESRMLSLPVMITIGMMEPNEHSANITTAT